MRRNREIQVDYGIDGPGWVTGFATTSLALLIAACKMALHGKRRWALRALLAAAGTGVYVANSIWTSRVGKVRVRDQILTWADLQANATVLDVGCGRGLLAIGCALQRPQAWIVGLDRWRQWDQWDISASTILANARQAGVEDRITVISADARSIPCADETFSCVVSSIVIHNLSRRADRRQAIQEMYRVLQPGGRLVMFDIIHSHEYPPLLKELGAELKHVSTNGRLFFMPGRLIVAEKPKP
jgi:cyclopropane fatty-acyl-phospholipid synthase-like methyltransferase